MAIAGIPEVIHDFNMYGTGRKLVGLSGEVSMPDLEALTAEISGAGILGTYETPVAGHYGTIEQEIPFRVVDDDYFSMINPASAVDLMLRGAIQMKDPLTGAVRYVGMRVVYRGTCKKITIGTIKQAGAMDSSITIETTYLLIELDGKSKFELDKLNGVFKVNGVDLLAGVRRLT